MLKASACRGTTLIFFCLVLVAAVALQPGCISPSVPGVLPCAPPTSSPSDSHQFTPNVTAPAQAEPVPAQQPANGPGPDSGLEVHFLDVGQGDAMLVRCGGKSMLVDGGPMEAGAKVSSYLHRHGVYTIDVLVSTHPHADHIGGLLTVLNDFPVREVFDSGQVHPTQTYESYLTLIDQKNIRYRVPSRGDTISFCPGVTVQVLSPPASKLDDDLNENAIVLMITHGSVVFLLMSDAGFLAENSLLQSGYDLDSDVLKVGHQGSKYASCPAFLAAVSPGVSVVEVGDNPYGHPAPETLARLEAAGSKVYRTDYAGDVVVTSDGASYVVHAQREAPT